MSEGWSSFSDTEADLQSQADQLLSIRENVLLCADKLDAKSYAQGRSDEIAKVVLRARQRLTGFDAGLQLSKDLAVANQLITTRVDHRSVEVMRFCLLQFASYLAAIAEQGSDQPALLLTAYNELAAFDKKPLLSESLFVVSDRYRVDVDALRQVDYSDDKQSAPEHYLGFSQAMLGIYRGESRDQKLQLLSESFAGLASKQSDKNTRAFWLTCSAFTAVVYCPRGELRPGLFSVFKQIESVLVYALGEDQKPVLGIQQTADRLLSNLLCYLLLETDYKHEATIEQTFNFTGIGDELHELHQSSPEQLSEWLTTSIGVLTARLQHCAAILAEEALQSDESINDFLGELAALKRLLVVIGVRSARENLEEAENTLKQSVTSESMQSAMTSLQLTEQQMLFQFARVNNTSTTSQVTSTDAELAHNTQSVPAHDFGARCNLCIDVIQQSLDTALGSSGNLIPDSSVVSALNKLIAIVSDDGIDELTALLTPLSQMLTKSENSTLNQSETLLVQEVIIAATLGIDSLVSDKPMPDLLVDVTQRVEGVLASASERINGAAPPNSLLSSFLVEAEEMLPRLFELFQRLRGAPNGSDRLVGDINRLLHAFKFSADDAEEHELGSLVHYLESTMVDMAQGDAPPSATFFDLAIETIESLGEDVERLRNSEAPSDRSDLIDRLRSTGPSASTSASVVPVQTRKLPSHVASQRLAPSAETPTDAPGDTNATGTTNTAGDTKPTVEQRPAGMLLLETSQSALAGIDWMRRFRQIDACCDAISNSQIQLVALQKQLEDALQSGVAEDVGSPVGRASDANSSAADDQVNHQIQSLAEQLKLVVENQTAAVSQLDRERGKAARLDTALLAKAFGEAIHESAVANDVTVQFAFTADDAQLQRDVFDLVQNAVVDLLTSIVAYTIPSTAERQVLGLSPHVTVAVSVTHNYRATLIDIVDDGSGVTIQGAQTRSNNPWSQVAKADWQALEESQRGEAPQVWSTQTDHSVDITGLLNVTSEYGATLAIRSDAAGTHYRVCLPVTSSVESVVVCAVQDQLLAIPAASVHCVGIANPSNVESQPVSLARLIGLKKDGAFQSSKESHCVSVNSLSGVQQILVDEVLGHQTLQFTTADRILPDVPGYLGVSVIEADQIVTLLDIDYWSVQLVNS